MSLWRWEVSLWRVSLGRVALGESLDLRIVSLHLQPVVEASVHRARPTSSHDTHLCVDVDVLLVLVVPAMRPGHIIILILRLEVDKLHRQRAPPPQPPRHKGTQAGSEACVRAARARVEARSPALRGWAGVGLQQRWLGQLSAALVLGLHDAARAAWGEAGPSV